MTYGKESIIIKFCEEKKTDEMISKYSDIDSCIITSEFNTFFNNGFNEYFKSNIKMSDEQISMFRNLILKFIKINSLFLTNKISLYEYINELASLRKKWNEKYPYYNIVIFNDSSIRIDYMK